MRSGITVSATRFFVALLACISFNAFADSAEEIEANTNSAIARFHSEVHGAKDFLKTAKGVLVFPRVFKAGFGIGAEGGEGVLRINDKSDGYYSIFAASIGLQFGAQVKDVIFVFLQDQALQDFKHQSGWKVGVDGSVALVAVGVGQSLDTMSFKEPIVAFVVGQKGLMYNLTLEGSKISKLDKTLGRE